MANTLDICIDPIYGLLWSVCLIGFSGLPSIFIKSAAAGRTVATILTLISALPGLFWSFKLLYDDSLTASYQLGWAVPFEQPELSADPLTVLFLIPLFLAAICSSIYCQSYLASGISSGIARRVLVFNGLLLASMALVLLARHTVLLLMAWELMALSSWLLLMTDHKDSEVRRSGTIYLLFTHVGTLFLFLLFALLKSETGSFLFPGQHSLVFSSSLTMIVLISALIGFGAKAGIMPLHIWLPGAHANAPSHASALMSGIMLKVGLYGIIRTALFFSQLPTWFGWLVLLLGTISALVGIALASVQQDLKRLLAYSSIENIGIICIGLGMTLIGLQSGNMTLAVLGGAGAFIHLINHALFKPLLFFGSGLIIHASGTRQMDRMGGLAKLLPQTSRIFMVGAIAIAGLPPLNGFVGEFFLYIAAFKCSIADSFPFLGLIAPLLAIVGGLALITFVKLYNTLFSGTARGEYPCNQHPEPLSMLLPIGLLATLCILIGLFAPVMLSLTAPVLAFVTGLSVTELGQYAQPVALHKLAWLNAILLLVALACWLLLQGLIKRGTVRVTETWGCGYLAPTSRMQYTGSSFSAFCYYIVSGRQGELPAPIGLDNIFARPERVHHSTDEWLLNEVVLPGMQKTDQRMAWFRKIQHGHLHFYILYILITLLVLIFWSRSWS